MMARIQLLQALFVLPLACGWTPPQFLRQVVPAVGIATVLTTAPLISEASRDFTGSYADPNHPNCQRVIQVSSADGVVVSGTDGTPGCPADGSGRAWKLSGKVEDNTILVDFSPKGGPPGLKGVWDATEPAGIKWPDGNKWTLK